MQIEATVTTRVYGLILTYPGITAREITTTLRETCDIDNSAAVNSAINVLKGKNCIIAVKGPTARSTMYYQGPVMPVLRSPEGQRRKDVSKAAALTNQRAAVMQEYYEVSNSLAALLKKMETMA